jgi:nitroreductase
LRFAGKMMDALTAILSRRSIRHYTSLPISSGIITQLLEAAMNAPSACDLQPWHFILIDDRQTLDAIPGFHNNAAMLPEAPAAILVCGEPGLSRSWQQDCSAACQNVLLAAHALGLGAVWLGIYPREHRVNPMRSLLGIPEEIVPMALIAFGCPGENQPPRNRFNQERVRHNRW